MQGLDRNEVGVMVRVRAGGPPPPLNPKVESGDLLRDLFPSAHTGVGHVKAPGLEWVRRNRSQGSVVFGGFGSFGFGILGASCLFRDTEPVAQRPSVRKDDSHPHGQAFVWTTEIHRISNTPDHHGESRNVGNQKQKRS